jgi:hypothetical protein
MKVLFATAHTDCGWARRDAGSDGDPAACTKVVDGPTLVLLPAADTQKYPTGSYVLKAGQRVSRRPVGTRKDLAGPVSARLRRINW